MSVRIVKEQEGDVHGKSIRKGIPGNLESSVLPTTPDTSHGAISASNLNPFRATSLLEHGVLLGNRLYD